jgi:hypothetical protein
MLFYAKIYADDTNVPPHPTKRHNQRKRPLKIDF